MTAGKRFQNDHCITIGIKRGNIEKLIWQTKFKPIFTLLKWEKKFSIMEEHNMLLLETIAFIVLQFTAETRV